MVRKRRRGRKDRYCMQETKEWRESALPASLSQFGLNVWERRRSKSGLRGERPVAFTEREGERDWGKRERESER